MVGGRAVTETWNQPFSNVITYAWPTVGKWNWIELDCRLECGAALRCDVLSWARLRCVPSGRLSYCLVADRLETYSYRHTRKHMYRCIFMKEHGLYLIHTLLLTTSIYNTSLYTRKHALASEETIRTRATSCLSHEYVCKYFLMFDVCWNKKTFCNYT